MPSDEGASGLSLVRADHCSGNVVPAGMRPKRHGESTRAPRPQLSTLDAADPEPEASFEEPVAPPVRLAPPRSGPNAIRAKPRGDRQSGAGARGGPTGPKKKVKSGEALAKAQRGSTAVVAGARGKKITFD